MNSDGLPAPSATQVLASIRFNLQELIAPELQSTMAQHVCRMAQQMIGHLIVAETEWPRILARQLIRQTHALKDAAQLLKEHALGDAALERKIGVVADSTVSGGEPRLELEQRNRQVGLLLEDVLPLLYELADRSTHPSVIRRINAVVREVIAACAETERDYKNADQKSVDQYTAKAGQRAVVTLERLQSYLSGKFPERTSLRVLSARELAGGFGKMTLLFDVEGFEPGVTSLVMRRNRPNGATETSVRDEFPLLQEMKRAGLPVPEPLWLEDSTALDYPFIVVRRVEGRPGGDLWKPDPSICTAATARDLAQVMARLHALDPAGLALGSALAGSRDPNDIVRANVATLRELWTRKRLEPDPALEASLCWLEHNIPRPPPRAHIIHSDVGFHNLLIKDEKISGLLDWELTHLGDPVEDLSYVRPYVEQLLPWTEFLAAYRDAGGQEYSEDVAHFYGVWRGVRNTVYTYLCHHAFCTDANLDLRFGHTGIYYARLILLEAATMVSQLGVDGRRALAPLPK